VSFGGGTMCIPALIPHNACSALSGGTRGVRSGGR
jgi:hypothetical protein